MSSKKISEKSKFFLLWPNSNRVWNWAALKRWRTFGHQQSPWQIHCAVLRFVTLLTASLSLLTCFWSESIFELCFLGSETKHVMKQRSTGFDVSSPIWQNLVSLHILILQTLPAGTAVGMWKVGREHSLKKYYQDANLENISRSDIIYSFWPKTDLFVTRQCLFRKCKLILLRM